MPPNPVDATHINAIIPLAVLEAVRSLDRLVPQDSPEYQNELAPKRLGMNPTVTAQIERYRRLVRRGADVDAGEVAQLFRLVGRRSDAALAFSQGGRWAAKKAYAQRSPVSRVVNRILLPLARDRIGLASATRLAARVFGAVMSQGGVRGVVVEAAPPSIEATPAGEVCGFYGAALAEVLRCFTDFDGAMVHSACRARGDELCRWQTGSTRGW